MSTQKKKRISKKTKSGWRKSDIKDVEQYLEDQRQEERIGVFAGKKDEDLFVVDKTPLQIKRVDLTEKQKRKLNAKKPLRSLEPLINTSKVEDPIVKRNVVRNIKNGRIIEEEIRNPTKPRHFQANRDRARYYEELENKQNKKGTQCVKDDLWTEKDFRDQLPGLKDEKGWVSRELALHVTNNVGKKVIKVHDGIRHRTTKAKNFEPPHPGISYNPSLQDHQNLIEKIVEREEGIIREEKHLKRVTTEMFSKVTPEERDRRRIEEMSAELEDPEFKTNENTNSETTDKLSISINPPTENKKKTKQERNRELRHKDLLKKQKAKKSLKQHIADLTRVKSLKAEVVAEEEELNELQKRRKKTAMKKKFEPKRLARLKYVEPDADVNMAEDIAGNLRNVKTESSLLIDRFKNFQKRNILPTSVAVGKQKARKIKRFTRASHKEDGVSYQMLREQRKQLKINN